MTKIMLDEVKIWIWSEASKKNGKVFAANELQQQRKTQQ